MKISTLDLCTFVTIVDLGGISAAARKLGLQKSTISRDLAALEERLGTRLLQRTTRRIVLTDAGQVLATYARRVREELENAEIAVAAFQDAPRGHLVITVPYAFLRFILAPELRRFQALYPQVQLSIDPSTRVLDLIMEGVDVAVRIGDLPTSSLIARKLGSTPMVLVAAPDYIERAGMPKMPETLVLHRLIGLGARAGKTEWEFFDRQGKCSRINLEPAVAIAEPSIVLDLAKRGHGIAAVPLIYAQYALDHGQLLRLLPDLDLGMRPIHAVYPSRQLLAPKVRVFIDFLLECMEAASSTASTLPAPSVGVEVLSGDGKVQ